MSGHSKWAQIKRQKGAADVKRGMAYTKLANTIAVAVRESGKDPTLNLKLRLAIDKAKAANMPSATIERAILRGAGELGGAAPEPVLYEGYAHGGIALLIDAITDNPNRTTAEVRRILTQHSGRIGAAGSVQWMFAKRGKIELPGTALTDAQELAVIDAGVEDIRQEPPDTIVYTKSADLEKVKNALLSQGIATGDAEIVFVPKEPIAVAAPDQRAALIRLVEELEELDDVTSVTTNAAS